MIGYITVPPIYSFQNDSLIKFIQTYSLVNSSFVSQEYIYFFKDIDPNYNYHFTRDSIYFLKVNGLNIGPFPVFFSYLTAFFFLFPFNLFSVLSGIIYFLILYIIYKYWKIDNLILLLGAIGTSLLIYALEYSENIYYLLFLLLFFTLFFKFEKLEYLAAIFLGLSAFLRLESIIIYIIFNISIFYSIIYLSNNVKIKNIIIFNLVFIIIIIIFFIYNNIIYDNFLGPRFIADRANFWNIQTKINNYISLYFGNPIFGAFKLGFFGLTPIFLIAPIYLFFKFRNLDNVTQIFLIFFIGYVLIVPGLSPHDGHWSWGARYFIPVLIPSLVLSDVLLKISGKKIKILFIILLVYSALMNQIGVKIISLSVESMKNVQNIISSSKSDIRIFDSHIFALFTGTQLIYKPTLVLKGDDYLREMLGKMKSTRKGTYVSYFQSGILNKIYMEFQNEDRDRNKVILDNLSDIFKNVEKKELSQFEIVEYIFNLTQQLVLFTLIQIMTDQK